MKTCHTENRINKQKQNYTSTLKRSICKLGENKDFAIREKESRTCVIQSNNTISIKGEEKKIEGMKCPLWLFGNP